MKALFSAAAAMALLAGCATAQSTGTATTTEAAPAVAEESARPDLNGVWRVNNRAYYDLEAHHARHAMQLREGPYGPLPDSRVVALGAIGAVPAGESVVSTGDIPYTADALERRDANFENWIDRDPNIKCYQPGVPRANYMPFPFQIIMNEEQGQMLMAYEYAGAVRNVFLGEDPGEAPVDSWMGQNYGYWDGDDFVIEVKYQNGQTWLDRAGNYLPYGAEVTERYSRIDDNHIRYTATIVEPETYTEPWEISMVLYRQIEEDAQILEFNCVEFVEELLHGHLRREPLD